MVGDMVSRPFMRPLRGLGWPRRGPQLRERAERQAAENEKLVGELRERQALLEKLSRLQRSIGSRQALDEVLDAIVAGAVELIGDPVVGVRLVDPDDSSRSELICSSGVSGALLEDNRYAPIGTGAGGAAIERGELVVFESYADAPGAITGFVDGGLQAAMAAPIRERGEVAGSIVVASTDSTRTYGESEREMLCAFAEHAGLALNDARAAAETARLAFHDSLTGLPNRSQFLASLREAMSGEGGRRRSVAVLFADLDGFKTINDSLGHDAGDELLIMVAERLSASTRTDDVAARFGGDEFALLVAGSTQPEDLRSAGERLLGLLSEPFALRGREVHVSASVGVAVGSESAEELLRDVDLAMYRAKARGKGRYELFEAKLHAAAVSRLELEADLRHAAERGQLVLHYQPVCRLIDGKLLGLEALVRWQHPERGLIGPIEFIPIAEESGEILALGRWVLDEACRALADWRDRCGASPDLQVAVNLSGVQLEFADLEAEVSAALTTHGLRPDNLVLEITESALMFDIDANARKLAALRERGVRIAVDDFGTGYSSLEYLRRFPLDILKVAKPFIDDIADAEGSPAIAGAIIDLGINLGLRVVSEGVETAEQCARLHELGCEIGQGYLFSRPLPPDAIERLIGRGGAVGAVGAVGAGMRA